MATQVSFTPQIEGYIQEAEAAHPNLSPGLLRAAIWQESGGNPSAVSGKNAQGIAQVLPATAANPKAGLGVDIPPLANTSDPHQSVQFMANALDALSQKHGSEDTALAVYNAGPGVNLSKLPNETQGYVRSIKGIQNTLTGGPDNLDFMKTLKAVQADKGVSMASTPYNVPQAQAQSNLDALDKFANSIATSPKFTTNYSEAAPATPVNPQAGAPERTTAQKVGRIALGAAGGLGGAALGTLAGGPVGGIVGAGLGSAGADYLASKTFDPIQNPGASALESGVAGAAGQGIAMGVGKLLFPSAVKAGGDALLNVLGKDATPVPAQYFAGKGVNVLHNIGMSSFFSDSLANATDKAIQAARTAAGDYGAQVAAQTGVGAQIINSVADQAAQAGASASIAPLKTAAQALIGNTLENSPARSLLNKIINLPTNTLPFSVNADTAIANQAAAQASGLSGVVPKTIGLKEIRTELMDIARTTNSAGERGMAVKMGQLVDNAAEQSLTNVSPQLAATWRTGSATYKEGIQGQEISKILSQAKVTGEPGSNSGQSLINALRDYRLNNLNTPLDPAQVSNLTTYAKALTAAEGNGSKAFTLVTNGLQVNAVVRMAALGGAAYGAGSGNQNVLGASALMLLGPAALAKMMASPAVFRLMLAASKTPAETRMAGQLGSQLVFQMVKEGIISPDQAQPQPAKGAGQ